MDDLDAIRTAAQTAITAASSVKELDEVRHLFLGRKAGRLSAVLSRLGGLPPEERKQIGARANEVKAEVESALEGRSTHLAQEELAVRLEAERIDVTLPGRWPKRGSLHPLTIVTREAAEVFSGLGYTVVDGNEVETEYYNFIALNIPAHHPVRDEHDSFYLTDELLLRTETSADQIHTMEKQEPPLRVISPGRVHRRDAVDASHSHTFHQLEGLAIDRNLSFADLKGTLEYFWKAMFGPETRSRFRPDYFPFTEPSAEVSISCSSCGGSGCRVCKGTGWLEVGGCGMVHPNVLRNVGYDPEEWQGFAFGLGLDRVAMLRYGINDIRMFLETDLRFLGQFG
ncbi:MAG: phenylalanine--tRNA ligase subunit alpha [Armatimonadota bacterium]|nr:phenylalanine--tRNA ligase subunit alpha [Armatimonadota bacterium]